MKVGNVYFVRCNEFIKIGFAKDVERRFSELQTASPYELELFAVIRGVTPSLEKIIHEEFRQYKARGEWYYLTKEFCSRLCCMQHRVRGRYGQDVNTLHQVRKLFGIKDPHDRGSAVQRRKSARAELFARRRAAAGD